MFRQKIAQVTDCTCRLIPGGQSEYMIFKNANIPNKFINKQSKQQKQKYSLKTQSISSSKHQLKVNSANKTNFKPNTLYQDEKISIARNIDSKKKRIQASFPNSIQGSCIRGNPLSLTNSSQPQTFQPMRSKQPIQKSCQPHKVQSRTIRNSYNLPIKNCNPSISNFNSCKQSQIIHENKKYSVEDYYRYISNPYQNFQKNKENLGKANGENHKLKQQFLNKRLHHIKNTVIQQNGEVFYQLASPLTIKNHQSRGYSNDQAKKQLTLNKQFQRTKNQQDLLSQNKSLVLQSTNLAYKEHLKTQTQRVQSQDEQLKNWLQDVSQFFNSNPSQLATQGTLTNRLIRESTDRFQLGVTKNKLIKQKILVEKLNSFNDLLSNRAECQSLVDQSENKDNQNQQSIVIMRHQDFLQSNQPINSTSLPINSILKPINITTKQNFKNMQSKVLQNSMYNTNVKKTDEYKKYEGKQNSHITSCSNNMKKTVKVQKQYLTNNFIQ